MPSYTGYGGRLRHGRGGRRLLAREELVGPLVGLARLHQDGAQQEQPLRHRLQRLLPARLGAHTHYYIQIAIMKNTKKLY